VIGEMLANSALEREKVPIPNLFSISRFDRSTSVPNPG